MIRIVTIQNLEIPRLWSAARKEAQSQRLLGQPSKKPQLTDEQKELLRVEKSKTVTCPHCYKEGQCMVMHRWHFDNCKKKVTDPLKSVL